MCSWLKRPPARNGVASADSEDQAQVLHSLQTGRVVQTVRALGKKLHVQVSLLKCALPSREAGGNCIFLSFQRAADANMVEIRSISHIHHCDLIHRWRKVACDCISHVQHPQLWQCSQACENFGP